MIELAGRLYRKDDIVSVAPDSLDSETCRILMRHHGWFVVYESYETVREALS